jgi:hypothetical protein
MTSSSTRPRPRNTTLDPTYAMSLEDIAGRLGIRKQSVARHYKNAMVKLRRLAEERGIDLKLVTEE